MHYRIEPRQTWIRTPSHRQDRQVRNDAFRRLANYIFHPEVRIPMTTPVIETSRSMSFVLPPKRVASAPEPWCPLVEKVDVEPRVLRCERVRWGNVSQARERLGTVPGEKVEVHSYSGPWTPSFLMRTDVCVVDPTMRIMLEDAIGVRVTKK
jgi:hypothetical protein